MINTNDKYIPAAAESGNYIYDPQEGLFSNRHSKLKKINRSAEFRGKSLTPHRLAWYMYYGFLPGDFHIDHIDRNRQNNRINNLRLLTNQQNCLNVERRMHRCHGGYESRVTFGDKKRSKFQRDQVKALNIFYKHNLTIYRYLRKAASRNFKAAQAAA